MKTIRLLISSSERLVPQGAIIEDLPTEAPLVDHLVDVVVRERVHVDAIRVLRRLRLKPGGQRSVAWPRAP